MPPDSGNGDCTTYYTMQTAGMPPAASPHALMKTQVFLPNVSQTPLSSPRLPYSVGQPYPPKGSPGASRLPSVRPPSPNYFGLTVESAVDPPDSGALPRENWSPPSSSVRPFAAVFPKQLPLDANPEFEAFRRQIDAHRGRATFDLSTSAFAGLGGRTTEAAFSRPPLPRSNTHSSSDASDTVPCSYGLPSNIKAALTGATGNKMDLDSSGSLHDSAYVSSDSKRNSQSSMDPPSVLNSSWFESPAQIDSPFGVPEQRRSNLPHNQANKRQDAVPSRQDSGLSMITASEMRDIMNRVPESEVLILDVRVSPQYAEARIKGALNLCIPTTLLKRATFNLQKLQQTFPVDQQQEKFANWRRSTHLIVYDAASEEMRDAVGPVNMIKKFANEGYKGSTNILRGGFSAFALSCPDLIDRSPARPRGSLSLDPNGGADGGRVAPVIGGVMLPSAGNTSNPFFGNIRQNQDLVDGVGQMDIAVPSELDSDMLPRWLKDAVERSDRGKRVSDKFLQIELDEKARMMDAYSHFNPSAAAPSSSDDDARKVRLCGIEEGGKNRYKDILPFEHARVRLEGRPVGSCDYVNASHLKASRSHKRYIASQGPLPATFEDFWSVIWDQDVRVIVMLTAESEGGQLKCHPYWTGKEFGPIRLRSLYEKKVSLIVDNHADSVVLPALGRSTSPSNASRPEPGRRRAKTTAALDSSAAAAAQPGLGSQSSSSVGEAPYVIIRKFALSHAAHPFSPIREITHLHYPSWPDFGAPAEPSHLLALVELANAMQRAAPPVSISGTIASASALATEEEHLGTGPLNRRSSELSGKSRRYSGDLHVPWSDVPESDSQCRPMLVHCSAGCGRTGAFCTIDSVIDMLKRQRLWAAKHANRRADGEKRIADQAGENNPGKRRFLGKGDRDVPMDRPRDGDGGTVSPLARFEEPLPPWPASPTGSDTDEEGIDTSWLGDESIDLVARTVADFRCQRLSMVQSLRQFVLCYEAVIEWIRRLQKRDLDAESAPPARGRSGSMAL